MFDLLVGNFDELLLLSKLYDLDYDSNLNFAMIFLWLLDPKGVFFFFFGYTFWELNLIYIFF